MIDELDIVRRLGADAAEPDPDARRRVRARVLDGRRGAVRRRRRLWSLSVLAPAAAAALAVVLVLVLRPGVDGREFSGDRRQAATAPQLFPRPDQFLYVRSRTRYLVCSPGCRLDRERIREVWLSERHDGRIVERPATRNVPTRIGAVELYLGNRRFSHGELARWAPTGRELLEMLQRGRAPGQGDGGASYPFRQITDALSEVAMPANVRRAMLEALPLVPGVEELGEASDATGRRGIGYARLVEGQREEIVVDPKTATMLEQRTIVAERGAVRGFDTGDVVGRSTYLQRAVVERAGERP